MDAAKRYSYCQNVRQSYMRWAWLATATLFTAFWSWFSSICRGQLAMGEAVLEKFAQLLGVRVLGIEPQPGFHVDLGFTFLDETPVAVADLHLAMEGVARALCNP